MADSALLQATAVGAAAAVLMAFTAFMGVIHVWAIARATRFPERHQRAARALGH